MYIYLYTTYYIYPHIHTCIDMSVCTYTHSNSHSVYFIRHTKMEIKRINLKHKCRLIVGSSSFPYPGPKCFET